MMSQISRQAGALAIMFGGLLVAQECSAYAGETLATFDLTVSRFLMDSGRNIMYATVPSLNSVVAIDTHNLNIVSTTFVGSNPTGMALSNDGSRLYVANSGSNFVGVVDTQSNKLVNSLGMSGSVQDVEVGRDGRLYVLTSDSLTQRDPETGASVGPALSSYVYSGELAISPDKSKLYYADYGLSPASLYQFDVSGAAPILTWESPHGGTSGSNGQDLAISHDGSFISYATGAGQIGYSIAKYRTDGMLIEGSFYTDAYPREITFSPDDAVAYTVNETGTIKLWDTKTFLSLGQFAGSGEASELEVDASGRYLFAAYGGNYWDQPGSGRLLVLDTGRSVAVVPELSQMVLFPFGLLGIALVRRRRTPYLGLLMSKA